MQKLFKPVRLVIFFGILAAFITIFVSALYIFQLFDVAAAEPVGAPMRYTVRYEPLVAARGNIFDRNGVLLASGRPAYNVMICRDSFLLMEPTNMGRNNAILELVYFAMEHGVTINDTLPITTGAPFAFLSAPRGEHRRNLAAFLESRELDPDISAQDLLAYMRRRYNIDYTIGITDARLIAGIRYELELRVIAWHLGPYVFARDVGSDFVSLLEERGFPGVHVERGFIREYHTTYAAHLLGYIGPIPPHLMDRLVYDEDGPRYDRNALIGMVGAEFAFEEYLRGINGRRRVVTARDGTVLEDIIITPPIPGNHIYLTIDINLQIATETALRTHIETRNLIREAEAEEADDDENLEDDRITGGAVTVTDVWTGEVLAAASFPTFDRSDLRYRFNDLLADPTTPLVHRAAQGRYIPGSTFKMVTAFAALRHETINRYFAVYCAGIYYVIGDHDRTFTPRCHIFPVIGRGHGMIGFMPAMAQSCNYFFLHLADRIEGGDAAGARAIAQAAYDLGLGRRTGIEIPEDFGVLATPEWLQETQNAGWRRGYTVSVGFGQGENRFTPLQLANHSATIANGGTLHALTLLRRVRNFDMTEVFSREEPVVLNSLNETDREHIRAIQESMEAVTQRSYFGTAASLFNDHPIPVAAKTGTVQIEGQRINDAVFIAYAPAPEPEIAIAVVVEQGGSGAAIMDIARSVIDHHFRDGVSVLTAPFGELIP